MKRCLRWVLQRWRATRLRCCGVSLQPGATLARGIEAKCGWRDGRAGQITIGRSCQLEAGVVLAAWGGRIRIGRHIYLGPYAVIYGHGGVEIGDDTLVSMHCRILSSDHAMPGPGVLIRSQPDKRMPTKIGRDVWLGGGVTVLGGVTIGDGCVVGAGAVVTHDLPPNSVALGVPAEVIRQRK